MKDIWIQRYCIQK